MKPIVFCDVDGTLLNSQHKITWPTEFAIQCLNRNKIPFVIVSARGPSEIYPIFREYGFHCPIIAYSGSLIQDQEDRILWEAGFSKAWAKEILEFLEQGGFDLSWGVYAREQWIVCSREDPRILREESIVGHRAQVGTLADIHSDKVNKILCFCAPGTVFFAEQALQRAFPDFTIVPSSDILLEIMAPGVNKAKAAAWLCELWGYNLENAYAFGDSYNDMEMLEAVGHGYLMGNAPDDLKKRFPRHTRGHDHDGICCVLARSGLMKEQPEVTGNNKTVNDSRSRL